MKVIKLLLLLLPLINITAYAQDLRESVCVVEAEYSDEAKNKLGDYALWLSRKGFISESHVLSAYKKGTFGSGVVISTERGRFVLTNRHVVGYAPSVTISFFLRDTTLLFPHCEVLLTDKEVDLALITLPDSCTQPAQRLATDAIDDGQDIVAAGYPELGGKPSWQITKGSVSNAYLKIENIHQPFIQHTAPIDPGSSGGPLFAMTDNGYEIVGINTLKAYWRESVGLSIPASVVHAVIAKNDSSMMPDYKLFKEMSLNGETWYKMIDKMDKACVDSLRKMTVEMPLDVISNTLALDCTPEIAVIANKKRSHDAEPEKLQKSNLIFDSDFENFCYVRAEYLNAFGRTQQVNLIWEYNRYVWILGLTTSLIMDETRVTTYGSNEENIELRSTFGLGLRIGTQIPLHMGKYYAIPRIVITPTIAPGGIGLIGKKCALAAIFPFSVGNDFAFPMGNYMLSVGVHYTYDLSLYMTPTNIVADNNRHILKTGSFTSMAGKSSLGVSLAFGW